MWLFKKFLTEGQGCNTWNSVIQQEEVASVAELECVCLILTIQIHFIPPKYHVRQNLSVDQIYRRLWRMNRSSSDRWKKGRRAMQIKRRKDHHGQRLDSVQTAWRIEEASRSISGTWHEKPVMHWNEVGLKIKRILSWMSMDTVQIMYLWPLTSPWRP